MAYSTTDASLAQVADLPEIQGRISLRQLERVSAVEDWPSLRRRRQEQWENLAVQKLGDRLAADRVAQLHALERVWQVALGKLERDALQATSWEAVANVVVRISRRLDELRSAISSSLPSVPVPSAGARPALVPRLSGDEARAAAMLLIRMRRAEMRQKLVRRPGDEANGDPGNHPPAAAPRG